LHRLRRALIAWDRIVLDGLRDDSSGVAGARVRFFVGLALERLHRWGRAEEAYRAAISLEPDEPLYHWRLARVLKHQRKWWQCRDSLERAVRARPQKAHWHHELGHAHEAMRDFERAAASHRRALELSPNRATWSYDLGWCLEQLGETQQAERAYADALRLLRRRSRANADVGLLHERHGRWSAAARAFATRCSAEPGSATWLRHLGRAQQQCQRWDEAAQAYVAALALSPEDASTHTSLGWVRENLEQWDAAAQAYVAALGLSTQDASTLHYRAGYCLARAQRWDAACRELLASAEAEPTLRERLAAPIPADLSELRRDILCSPHHDAGSYLTLGRADFAEGRAEAACRALLELRPLKREPPGSPRKRGTTWTTQAQYVEYSETLPIAEQVILYESFHGRTVTCNPLALCLHLLQRADFAGHLHVWSLTARAAIPEELQGHPNVLFVRREGDAYLRHLASAKHLINNATFPAYFSRRPEQRYLNTWHGTPIKHMGVDLPGGFLEGSNVARNLLHVTHLALPNEHTAKVLLERFGVSGSFRGVVAETGYPRIDRTLGVSPERTRELRTKLGVPEGRRVVLYAPTFRGSVQQAHFDASRVAEALRSLRSLGCHILFRGHHLVQSALGALGDFVTVVPAHLDTNLLLGAVDLLITDYSSVAVDFMATGRPVVCYLHDLEDYRRERGLYFEPAEFPGQCCGTPAELMRLVAAGLGAVEARPLLSSATHRRLCPQEDGHACERVVALAFADQRGGAKEFPLDRRTSLLFHAGRFLPNGITHSLHNLLVYLDPARYAVTVVVEPKSIERFEARRSLLQEASRHAAVLGRVGSMTLTTLEAEATQRLSRQGDLDSPAMWARLHAAYRREARRLFGDGHFDVVVNYDGYGEVWPPLFAQLGGRRVIYQHSDMLAEATLRYPALHSTFRHYPSYDALVSVSAAVRDVNRHNLAARLGIPSERFVACRNPLDHARVRRLAKRPPASAQDAALLAHPGPKFITVARLSPEKGQATLLRAFAAVQRRHPQARLLLVGEGPMRQQLLELRASLGLTEAVSLLGWRDNPYPLLAGSDCFVFSSLHEGQGLALLEALCVGLPVVCSDFPAARETLAQGRGLVVEGSVSGLEHGMLAYLEGRLRPAPFDPERYAAEVFEDLEATLLSGRTAERAE